MFNSKQTFCENSSHGVSTSFLFINVANVDNDNCFRDVEYLSQAGTLTVTEETLPSVGMLHKKSTKSDSKKKFKKGELKIMKALPMNMI